MVIHEHFRQRRGYKYARTLLLGGWLCRSVHVPP